jgi:hypothetical protein
MNPKSFQLPRDIREQFENIFTHPITGEYMDDRLVEMRPANINVRTTRKDKLLPLPTPQLAEKEKEDLAVCFKCSKTGMKIQQTSFLNSNTVPSSRVIQTQRSELIECDFCHLHWHLDCLDPPLSCLPPELRMNELTTLDLHHQSLLKSRIWHGHPLDPILLNVPNFGTKSEYFARDLHFLENASPESSFLDHNRHITIRNKWMCPCHADWDTPKRPPRIKWNVIDLPSPKKKKRPIFKVTYHDPNSRSPSSVSVSSSEPATPITPPEFFKNNGWITIKNDQRFPENEILFEIPESRVQLEFLHKVDKNRALLQQGELRMTPELYKKFEEYGNKVATNVHELFGDVDEDPYSVPLDFGPVVEDMVSDVNEDVKEVNYINLDCRCHSIDAIGSTITVHQEAFEPCTEIKNVDKVRTYSLRILKSIIRVVKCRNQLIEEYY